MHNNGQMKIGELARRSGIGIETLRFYEREGLLPAPPRTASGYRMYPAHSTERVQFILRAKQLGFTLNEVRELLRLHDADGSRADVKRLAGARLGDIRQRIEDLQRMEQALSDLHMACDGQGTLAGCPIIKAIASSDQQEQH